MDPYEPSEGNRGENRSRARNNNSAPQKERGNPEKDSRFADETMREAHDDAAEHGGNGGGLIRAYAARAARPRQRLSRAPYRQRLRQTRHILRPISHTFPPNPIHYERAVLGPGVRASNAAGTCGGIGRRYLQGNARVWILFRGAYVAKAPPFLWRMPQPTPARAV